MKMNLFRGRCSGTTILVFLQTLKEFYCTYALSHFVALLATFCRTADQFQKKPCAWRYCDGGAQRMESGSVKQYASVCSETFIMNSNACVCQWSHCLDKRSRALRTAGY